MRDAAFVKACSLIERFRKESQHWRKLLYQVSDEQSVANKALTDIAKHCGLKSWTIPQLVESVGLALAEDPAALQEALSKMTKERDAQSALVAKQRHLLAAKQTEIGALEAERDEMKEEIKQANKEASDATARQRMTEARALNYSLQAEEARRETERLRAKLASRTVEWPEWAKVGARVRVRSTRYAVTQCNFVGGEEFVVAKADEYEWALMSKHQFWAHVSDLEPVAEHTQPAVEYVDRVGVRQGDAPLVVSPQVGDTVRLIKRPSTADYDGRQWDHTWGEAGEIAVVNYVGLCVNVNRANGWKNDWPLSCVEVVKGGDK